MKLSSKLENVLNDQINLELCSAYAYLGMAAYFDRTPFTGFAKWMQVQSAEELGHANRAVGLLSLVAVACGLQAALAVVRLTDDASQVADARGSLVAVLVLTVLYLMGVLVARGALAQNQPQGTAVAVVVAASLLLVGLVLLAVVSASDHLTATFVDQLLAFVVPVVLAVLVAVPAVRSARGAMGVGPTTSLPPRP